MTAIMMSILILKQQCPANDWPQSATFPVTGELFKDDPRKLAADHECEMGKERYKYHKSTTCEGHSIN